MGGNRAKATHGIVLMALAMLGVSFPAVAWGGVDDDKISNSTYVSIPGANWPTGGGNYDELHFSSLDQINDKTISRLGLAWSLELPGEHTLEAMPLAIDGVLYFTGQRSSVYAVDAVKGSLLWKYDPEIWRTAASRLRYVFGANRGVAYWKGKLFVGTLDGRLVALDAKTGSVLWSTMTIDPKSKHTITGQPRAYNGKVVIGNGGADYGERGYVTAYDTETGKQIWRFYTAPGSPAEDAGDPTMEMAAKSWSGEYWKKGTGGTVWNSVTYDPHLNRIYFGTGNAAPYDPAVRSPGDGDNLFTVSIVALDADTGKYAWHYQVNPREAWDYDNCSDIQLAELKLDGVSHRVLMQAPKNGFFYVIDRDSGKLLSAEKTGKVTWAERIDLKTGRPVEAANIRYENGPFSIWPSPYGTHDWQAMSFDPATGLTYIPYMQAGTRYASDPNSMLGGTTMTPVLADKDDGTGKLLAWDPVAQKLRWSISHATAWNGGVLSTAGHIVFQGIADGGFAAYDTRNGKKLWNFDAKLGIIAAPITFSVKGTQYVSILVGYGGATGLGSRFMNVGWKYGLQPRRLLTFALGGSAKLPATPPASLVVQAVDDPNLVIDDQRAKAGMDVYSAKNCVMCHGSNVASAGAPGPDLRESAIALDKAAFGTMLRTGPFAQNGMPAFSEITDLEIDSLYMLIRKRARETLVGESVREQ